MLIGFCFFVAGWWLFDLNLKASLSSGRRRKFKHHEKLHSSIISRQPSVNYVPPLPVWLLAVIPEIRGLSCWAISQEYILLFNLITPLVPDSYSGLKQWLSRGPLQWVRLVIESWIPVWLLPEWQPYWMMDLTELRLTNLKWDFDWKANVFPLCFFIKYEFLFKSNHQPPPNACTQFPISNPSYQQIHWRPPLSTLGWLFVNKRTEEDLVRAHPMLNWRLIWMMTRMRSREDHSHIYLYS